MKSLLPQRSREPRAKISFADDLVVDDENESLTLKKKQKVSASTPSKKKLGASSSELSAKPSDGKIVFLSKKQREQINRERAHEKEARLKAAREEVKLNKIQAAEQEARAGKTTSSPDGTHYKDQESHRLSTSNDNDSDTEKTKSFTQAFRAYGQDTESSLSKLNLLDLKKTEVHQVQNQRTLLQIREHYLGLRKEKRKIQKPSEKFRNIFNFEWNTSEDTTRVDSNNLYLSRVEPQLLFGRGFRAGIDVREQRRYNNFYDELVKNRVAVEGEDLSEKIRPDAKDALLKLRDIDSGDPNKKHWTEKKRDEMTDRDWRIFREDYEIYIKGGRVPPPIRSWEEAELSEPLMNAIQKVKYKKPTPIQMQAIPIALVQRDMIGIAETGSGKTAAFVLPMLTYVGTLPPLTDETSQDGPYALILAPSRELAIQIHEEMLKFAAFTRCRAVAVVGGRSAEGQAFELRCGTEVVIGTPGRIKDCLERAYTVLSQCNYVILDEADRMIDMGFEEIVNWILDQIPSSNLKSEIEDQAHQQELESKAGYRKYRVTQMFSATMPPAVERLARKYLRSPAYISIGDPGAGKRAIEQVVEFLSDAKKKQRLQDILENAEPPIMIFVNQKRAADMLAKTLIKFGYSATSLHGGKTQDIREQSLTDFKSGAINVLVATDVAGRGIDVEGVRLVINFDMPKDIGSYTHRIGRTGRAGRKGLAISFCTEEDSHLYYDLKQLLISTNNVVPLELSNHPSSKAKPGAVASAPATTSTSSSSLVLHHPKYVSHF